MEFKEFKTLMQNHVEEMVKDVDHLFEVNVDKDELWNLYLDSFPEGTNPVYRERREYDDSACRHFVRNFGGVVKIKNNQITTIWDFTANRAEFQSLDNTKFQTVNTKLSKFLKEATIADVYVTKISKIGTDFNYEEINGQVNRWDHLYIELPKKFVVDGYKSEATIKGDYRSTKDVFKRSLQELTQESVKTVLELIAQNSLYKGKEWESILKSFLQYKINFDKLETEKEKDLFAWENSVIAGSVVGRIRNHSMGTLLIDISEGIELDKAVRSYEKIVAPLNYKRPQAIFTQKMLDEAKKKIENLGYLPSLKRRHAVLDDITVNNILFSNKDSAKRIAGTDDLFESMSKSIPVNAKKFSKIEEINVEDFISKVLPLATEVELLLENKHTPNMVSLIAPVDKTAPSMFKWDNAFSWAYSGNITDSSLKENVKSAGGNVDGVMRFSIQWNDGKEYNGNDLDAHCVEPNGNRIYYGGSHSTRTKGRLDIDIRNPKQDQPAVENIFWKDKNNLIEGNYQFLVHNYMHRGGRDGFKAEIEIDGEIYSFEYNKDIKQDEKVIVAEVNYTKENGFKLIEKLTSSLSSKNVWGVDTNQFVPVSVVMYSPNYWDEQKGIGNCHVFFMLKDCVNTEKPNGFYNEFLNQELNEHRKVMEALGSKTAVETVDDQLSGVGFSSTKRNEATVKVKGQTERVLKVLF